MVAGTYDAPPADRSVPASSDTYFMTKVGRSDHVVPERLVENVLEMFAARRPWKSFFLRKSSQMCAIAEHAVPQIRLVEGAGSRTVYEDLVRGRDALKSLVTQLESARRVKLEGTSSVRFAAFAEDLYEDLQLKAKAVSDIISKVNDKASREATLDAVYRDMPMYEAATAFVIKASLKVKESQ